MPPCVTARMPWKFTAILVGALNAATALAGPIAKFDIPAQALGTALQTLSTQAGITLSFRPETLGSARSMAISGEMSVDDALRQLLAGSGRAFRQEGTNNYVLLEPARGENEGMLSEVVVTATRTERRLDEVPASVSVLNEKDIATKKRQNITDALRDVEGLDFFGKSGARQAAPTIRGFNAQVLVGGMAQESILAYGLISDGIGLNFMPLHDVERVEIVRGPASALYGPNTVGGVINVLPKRWSGGPGAEVNTSYGSHNTRTFGAAAGTSGDTFDIRLSAFDAQSDGFKANPVSGSYAFDLAPRDWKDKKLGLIAGFHPAEGHEFSMELRQFEIDYAGAGGRPNFRNEVEGKSSALEYRYDWTKDTNIKFNFTDTKQKQRYVTDRYPFPPHTDVGQYSFGGRDGTATFFQGQIQTLPFAGNDLILGYTRDTGKFQQTEGKPAEGITGHITSESQVDGLFIQDEQQLGALTLTAGIRQDRIKFFPSTNLSGARSDGSVDRVINPRLGARYRLSENTSFYASYGTSYVPATPRRKFASVALYAGYADNPDLKPESSKTYEIGMSKSVAVGDFRLALFHTDYRNKINDFGKDPVSGKRQSQNVAAVKVSGLGLTYQGDIGGGWMPYANFSYTKARDYPGQGKPATQSARIAPRKLNAGVTYAPSDAWAATLNARYVSAQHSTTPPTPKNRIGSYTQVDLKLNARIPRLEKRWDVFVAVNNLTHKKYGEFNDLEWSDGRTFAIGLQGKF